MLWFKQTHNMNQLDLKTALQLLHLSLPPLIQTSKQQQLSHHLLQLLQHTSTKAALTWKQSHGLIIKAW